MPHTLISTDQYHSGKAFFGAIIVFFLRKMLTYKRGFNNECPATKDCDLLCLITEQVDHFFVPPLNFLSEKLHLSPSVAGVTLMALGNGESACS